GDRLPEVAALGTAVQEQHAFAVVHENFDESNALRSRHDVALEDFREFRGDDFADVIERDVASGEMRDRGHARAVQAARRDEPEVIEIRAHVERETMRRDPSRDAHADRGNLVVANPDAALPVGAFGGDAEFGDGADQHFFEFRDVLAHIAIAFAEVDDWIADELAGTVIGDVAAARGLEKTDALRVERGGGRE